MDKKEEITRKSLTVDKYYEKIKNKYESNEYYFRWMNRGIMPEKILYH